MLQTQVDQTAIQNVVETYIERMSRSDIEGLVSLFTQDAVLMAPEAPTMDGADQMKAFFGYGFTTVKLTPKIHIDEIVVAGDHAFVRCHSDVQITVLETDVSHRENNRELFVFQKSGGEWKIARYMFNRMPNAQ